MGIVTEMPNGTPTTNALDVIPEDLLGGPVPARIEMSGKTLLVLDRPPTPGEYLKVEITLQCKGEGFDVLADGTNQHYRKTRLIGATLTTEPYAPEPESPPVPDDDQDALIGRDGEISGGLDEFDPEFSHNGSGDK